VVTPLPGLPLVPHVMMYTGESVAVDVVPTVEEGMVCVCVCGVECNPRHHHLTVVLVWCGWVWIGLGWDGLGLFADALGPQP